MAPLSAEWRSWLKNYKKKDKTFKKKKNLTVVESGID